LEYGKSQARRELAFVKDDGEAIGEGMFCLVERCSLSGPY